MTPIAEMGVHARVGKMALQKCTVCGAVQYPPRELCWCCLGDALEWQVSDREPGRVLATTTLHHSHDVQFRSHLPLHVGLVRLDAGPMVICFLAEGYTPDARVVVSAVTDDADRPVLSARAA